MRVYDNQEWEDRSELFRWLQRTDSYCIDVQEASRICDEVNLDSCVCRPLGGRMLSIDNNFGFEFVNLINIHFIYPNSVATTIINLHNCREMCCWWSEGDIDDRAILQIHNLDDSTRLHFFHEAVNFGGKVPLSTLT
mgnify:CR=1 FL=1